MYLFIYILNFLLVFMISGVGGGVLLSPKFFQSIDARLILAGDNTWTISLAPTNTCSCQHKVGRGIPANTFSPVTSGTQHAYHSDTVQGGLRWVTREEEPPFLTWGCIGTRVVMWCLPTGTLNPRDRLQGINAGVSHANCLRHALTFCEHYSSTLLRTVLAKASGSGLFSARMQ